MQNISQAFRLFNPEITEENENEMLDFLTLLGISDTFYKNFD